MIETTVGEALKDYGDRLEIASTAAIEKKGRTDEVRVLYVGSNGLDLNPGIRVRDQVKYQTSADAKGVVAEAADEGGPHFSLKYDITKAHRRVAVEKCDWGRQACQIKGSAAATAQLRGHEMRQKQAGGGNQPAESKGKEERAEGNEWIMQPVLRSPGRGLQVKPNHL